MNRAAGDLETRHADVAARKSIHRRRRGLSPFAVLLAIAVVGSLAFLAYSFTQQLAELTAALVAVGVVSAIVTLAAVVATFRAGRSASGGHALLYALIGGFAAIGASVSIAAALILATLQR